MADNIVVGDPATSHNGNKLLDTLFARQSPLTEEQFSFIIHHVDQGAGSADIRTLLCNTFLLRETISTIEETITWIRGNVRREQFLLRRAKQYVWCTTPEPPVPKTDAGNSEGRRKERKWTDDMKAFMLWKYELGHQKLAILDSLNAQFKTQFNISSFKMCLTNIAKNDQTKEFLQEYAKSFDWWKPQPAPDSPEGVRAARHARRRAASKRLVERAQVQKQWINGFNEFESEELRSPEATTGKGKARAPTPAANGTLNTPIKIEDSDGDETDTMSDVVLTHLNEIADEMVRSPSDQLSPTPLQRVPPRCPKPEVDDDDDELELSNDWDEEEGTNLSDGYLPTSSISNLRSGEGSSKFSAKPMRSTS